MSTETVTPATKGKPTSRPRRETYTDEPYQRTEEEIAAEREKQRERALRSYYKNKEAILERRKQRYHEDPEFRARVLEQSRRINEKRARDRTAKLKDERFIAETPRQFRIDLPDGKYVIQDMFTTSQLAIQLNRKAGCVIAWEKMGLLPETLYRGLNKFRLYTDFQVREIVRIYKELETKFGRRRMANRIGSTPFFQLIKELWENYPLGVDTGAARGD